MATFKDIPKFPQAHYWYLGINAGGTPHTKKELDRVRKLLSHV